MEPVMAYVIGGQVQRLQTVHLLGHSSTDVADTGILEVVVSHIENAKGVVGAQNGAQMLAILGTQVVAAQPEFLQVLIELHGRHCRRDRERTFNNNV